MRPSAVTVATAASELGITPRRVRQLARLHPALYRVRASAAGSRGRAARDPRRITGGEAWDLVKSGAVLEPGSRAYRAAQIVGGQYYIRHADVERDLPFIERRFLQAFADLEKVDPVREALPQIVKPEVRIALRGPAHASHFIPDFRQRADGDDT